jgi:hypothetical protein
VSSDPIEDTATGDPEGGDTPPDSPDEHELPWPACDEHHEDHTVGLITCRPGAQEGYTLFAPISAQTAYLIDLQGRVVQSWELEYSPGNVVYLLENGHLLVAGQYGPRDTRLQAGGQGGIVQEYDWDGNVLWTFEYSTDDYRQHHDVEPLPNGHVLLVAWEYKSSGEAASHGRNPDTAGTGVWPDTIIEVDPTRGDSVQIVWEWHAWDHVIQDFAPGEANYGDVAEHPELIDLNFTQGSNPDWLHINAVAYNAELDQIILSVHNLGEIWMIDHSTTTEEASTHSGGDHGMGGDLLYRWGNPRAYRAGERRDQWLFGQHDSHWIPDGLDGAGDILIFDNGMSRPGGEYSRIVQMTPPLLPSGRYEQSAGAAFGPANPTWTYVASPPESFFSSNISGAQRLANGNTLICSGASGRLFEVTDTGEILWEYVNPITSRGSTRQGAEPGDGALGPGNNVFRTYRYAPDYPGLSGRDLTPGDVLEL